MARLVEPINLSQLTAEGIEFEVDADFVKDHECDSEGSESDGEVEQDLDQCKKECLGLFDEDIYEEGEPFEIIARKMFDLTPDGKIKKRTIRNGGGEKPGEYATVKIHYNGYVEYEDHPFDSTYVRSKPHKFVVNDGRVIAGLDFAVQSMKLKEKSQFLIHPDYAYGKHSAIGRIPPNATVLFEVELLEIINCGAAITYEKLSEEQQMMFSEVYKYSTALCERGKISFVNHEYDKAIKDYNTAASKLEKVDIHTKTEIEQHRELSLKLYTNLLICYTRNGKPRKGCEKAEKIYELTNNGELIKIHAKVYYNHAKCLRFLGDYEHAKAVLTKAYEREPKNPEIANEMLNLEKDQLEHKKNQKVLAKGLFVGSLNS